jgi:hypothetical protein
MCGTVSARTWQDVLSQPECHCVSVTVSGSLSAPTANEPGGAGLSLRLIAKVAAQLEH